MKRRPLVLTVIAGLLVFLGVLFAYLPAGWFASRLPPGVKCGELAGSVWNGECTGLTVRGGKLGDATWNLAILKALTGKLVGNVGLGGGAMALHSDVDLSIHGGGTLSNLRGEIPLDPSVIPGLDPSLRGRATLDLKQVALGPDFAPHQAMGIVQVLDVRDGGVTYGSFEVSFDGVRQNDGTFLGHLRDLGGDFRVEGTVTVQPPATLQVVGFVTGMTADAERIVRRNIPFPPDPSGRSELRFETSF